MKTFLSGILFFFLSLSGNAQRNVVLLIADDLGTDYLGFYENHADTVAVPNIRKLLGKGIRFQNAMSNPVCSATRTGMLTGRYSFRTGVGAIVGGPGGSGQIGTSEITIPSLLQAFNPNIARANIGKWHISSPTPVSNLMNPLTLGYEHFEGPFIGAIPSYYSWQKYTNGVAGTVTTYATTENINNAITWMKGQNGKPVFLWLAFNAPHSPFHLPPAGLYSDQTLTGTTQHINANPKKYFKASLEALDHEIGRLFDSLQAMNRLDSTDFIFVGDNGNAMQTAQIANVNRAKGTIYQYGTHVPFIVGGPSVVNPGRVSGALVNTVDVFATVLDLFGFVNWSGQIPTDKPVDSKSILPILKNEGTVVRPWAFTEIFKVTTDADDGKTMRNLDFKLLHFDAGQEEFYHLTSDPDEAINLLNGTLTTTELSAYTYLCGEMTNLVGLSEYCDPVLVSVEKAAEKAGLLFYPNPFTSRIFRTRMGESKSVELRNSLGQILYRGEALEVQDLSVLKSGIYFIRTQQSAPGVFKIIKQ